MAAEAGFGSFESLSHGLLGNKHKFSVLVAIGSLRADGHPEVYARQVSKMLPHAADNQVGKIMRQLEEAGLLIRVYEKGDDLRCFYRVRDTMLWDMVAKFVCELENASWSTDPRQATGTGQTDERSG